MKYLNIICGDDILVLTRDECLRLEIRFNITQYGKEWSFIGDRLYYFVFPRNENDKNNCFSVTEEQLDFVRNIYQQYVM